jgi:hypothetical protein
MKTRIRQILLTVVVTLTPYVLMAEDGWTPGKPLTRPPAEYLQVLADLFHRLMNYI